MNVTRGKQNVRIGQYEEFDIQLSSDIVYVMQDNAVLLKQADGTPQMRISVIGNILSYQVWTGVQYSDPVPITIGAEGISQADADQRYYLKIQTLDQIEQPTNTVDMNNNKISDLANPTLPKDALNLQTADGKYYANTTHLNNILAPNGSVSIATYRITNLGNAILPTDALNMQTGDSRYYSNTTTLDNIQQATNTVNLNNHRISNLANPINPTDALNIQFADSRYSGSAVPVNQLPAPTGDFSLNNYKITNLGNATLATDALNRQTGDGRYYSNTTQLNNIVVPNNNVSLNNNKLTNVANATLPSDGLNQGSGDNRYYRNNVPLNDITIPDNDVSLNNNKLTNIGDATLPTDAMNQQSSDARYYENNITLNNITLPTGNVSLNNNKLTNVANATLSGDALNLVTGDNRYYLNNTPLNNIIPPTTDVSLNSRKLTNVGNATLATDALNRQTADLRYYSNNTSIDQITIAASDINLNSHKITNLANATLGTDALNRQTADGRFYSNTASLDQIQIPNSNVSLNSNKITNLANATVATDALNLQTADGRYYANTTTLNNIIQPNGNLTLNNNKITNLAVPTLSSDAATKAYVDANSGFTQTVADTLYYSNTTTLDDIQAPVADISLNSQKITNLATPTLSTDAVTKAYVDAIGGFSQAQADARYYQNNVVLNNITAPNNNLSLNSNKIVDLATPTLSTDAATKAYVDSNVGINQTDADARYYQNNVTLNDITLANGDLSVNSHKITNLSTPTTGNDAVNKTYVDTNTISQINADSRYYLNTTTLDSITTPTGNLSLNNNKITDLALPTQSTDATSKTYVDSNTISQTNADSRYYLNTTTLDSIATPTGDLSLNNNKITNLANPTQSNDATNKSYVDNNTISQTNADARYYQNTTTLDSIVQPDTNVSLNSNKIINLANATLATDALNQQSGDSRYYLNSTTLDSITAPSNNVSLNSHKLTNVSDATSATDALNRQTGDSRYYLNSTTLNSITTPTSDVSLNSNKITSLATPTISTDAATKGYVDSNSISQTNADARYYQNNVTLNDITAPDGNLSLNNNKITNLSNATLSADAVPYGQLTAIQSNLTGSASKVNCTNNNQIDFSIGGNQKLKLYVPSGQATNPCGLQTSDKMQLSSDLAAFSFTSTATQQAQPAFNTLGIYGQLTNDFTKNQNIQFQLQTVNSSGPQQSQALTIASGHVDVGTGMINYSTIYNKAGDGVQQNLQLSGGTPQTDNTINLYSNTYATSLGQALTCQFTGKTGYSSTTTIDQANQFASKAYVDSNGGLSQTTADGRYYLNTTVLNNITAPTGSLSLNSNKITNLADATLATDALNRQTADNRYYLSTVTLDSITAPTTNLSLNSNKIINLGTPTLSTDAATKAYVDSNGGLSQSTADNRYYLNTTKLNAITAPDTSLNLNSNKIINLATPTLSTDAATKAYVDSNGGLSQATADLRYYLNTIKLNAITAPDTSLSLNSNKITDLADATLATDALNRQTADSRYYLTTTTLNNITTPNGSLSLNSNKIINLATPTLDTDAATKAYVDSNGGLSQVTADLRYYLNTTKLSAITAPDTALSLNNQKITDLATPTADSDAVTKLYVDSNGGLSQTTADARYYLNTTTLDNITLPTSNVSLNNYKITNLSTPTLDSDAATKEYVDTNSAGLTQADADARYYLNTTTLNQFEAPVNSVNFAFQTLSNLGNAVNPSDALNIQTADTLYYTNITRLDQITPAQGPIVLGGYGIQDLGYPSLPNDAVNINYLQNNYYTQTQADTNFLTYSTPLNWLSQPLDSLNLSNQKIINLGTPTASTHGANKFYVDNQIANQQLTTTSIRSLIRVASITTNTITTSQVSVPSADITGCITSAVKQANVYNTGDVVLIFNYVLPFTPHIYCQAYYRGTVVSSQVQSFGVVLQIINSTQAVAIINPRASANAFDGNWQFTFQFINRDIA